MVENSPGSRTLSGWVDILAVAAHRAANHYLMVRDPTRIMPAWDALTENRRNSYRALVVALVFEDSTRPILRDILSATEP
jgi:hypothetical protein